MSKDTKSNQDLIAYLYTLRKAISDFKTHHSANTLNAYALAVNPTFINIHELCSNLLGMKRYYEQPLQEVISAVSDMTNNPSYSFDSEMSSLDRTASELARLLAKSTRALEEPLASIESVLTLDPKDKKALEAILEHHKALEKAVKVHRGSPQRVLALADTLSEWAGNVERLIIEANNLLPSFISVWRTIQQEPEPVSRTIHKAHQTKARTEFSVFEKT